VVALVPFRILQKNDKNFVSFLYLWISAKIKRRGELLVPPAVTIAFALIIIKILIF
jgi:hypothetical protein